MVYNLEHKEQKKRKELWMDLHTGTFICVKGGHFVGFCIMSSLYLLK